MNKNLNLNGLSDITFLTEYHLSMIIHLENVTPAFLHKKLFAILTDDK